MDRSNNRTIGWVTAYFVRSTSIGNRNAKTFRQLYEKLKNYVKHYYTDDWKVYRKIIPNEKLTQGKKYTIGIEQNNSNVTCTLYEVRSRHYLSRMTRRTKVVSWLLSSVEVKSIEMINISLLITCYLNEYNGYELFQNTFLSIFD